MKIFNPENSPEDFSTLGNPQLYWCDSSSVAELSAAVRGMEKHFDIHVLAKHEAPAQMSASVAEKRGAVGAFGFFDLTKQCLFREKIDRNQRTFFFDVMRVRPDVDRCAEFLSKQRDALGKSIFLFGTQKGMSSHVVKKCMDDHVVFLEKIDRRRYRSDGAIAGYVITEIYLEFLRQQLDSKLICIFHLFSDYSSRFLTVVGHPQGILTLESIDLTVDTLAEKDYQLVAPTYCFD